MYVLPPSDIAFLDTTVEALVGSTLDLPLAVYALLPGSKYMSLMLNHFTPVGPHTIKFFGNFASFLSNHLGMPLVYEKPQIRTAN